ncbi:cold shock domain-containing protein [Chloropicon primus]|uniref:Cold shock domain-containing protein n=2 Tax=Chloropicon primus TaxID=1764295 RepID=A0A5B8MD24_9CHLO|nr:cold shock domain-containing protein [Chloropicon primus]|eukprot:QDZ18446.1 cold shock domain-containing protein [Chloropicon primus]
MSGGGEEEFKEGVPPPGMGLASRERERDNGNGGGYGGRPERGRGGSRGFRGRGGYRGGRSGRGDRGDYDNHSHGPPRGQGRGGGGRHNRLEGTVESLKEIYPAEGEEEEKQPVSYEGFIAISGGGFQNSGGNAGEGAAKFHFKEEDVMGKTKLSLGDKVEFYKFDSGQPSDQGLRATRVRAILERGDSRRRRDQQGGGEGRQGPGASGNASSSSMAKNAGMFHLGVVVALKETYGFLLSLKTGSQYFFHFSEFIGSSRLNPRVAPPELDIGIVVRFVLAKNPATGKDIGKSLCLVSENGRPQFTLQESEERLVGTLVRAPSDLNLLEDIGDGLVEFEVASGGKKGQDSENKKQTAIVCKKQLNESHVQIDENDTVYFDCYRSDSVNFCIAKNVVLMKKPHETFDDDKRELGVISVLKGSFGFIACTERMADVFLHLSQISDVPKEELAVGRDVDFRVARGAETGRLQAMDIKLAEPGSAVFEEIEEGVYDGTVVERLPNPNLRKSNPSLLLTGLIEGMVDGRLQKFPFMHTDRENKKLYPKQGDKVTFQIVTDLKRERAAKQAGKPGLGRRATKIVVKTIEGTVAAMKGSFGFIEYDKPKLEGKIEESESEPAAAKPEEKKYETKKDETTLPTSDDGAEATEEGDKKPDEATSEDGADAKEDDKPGADAKEDDKPGADAKEDDKPGADAKEDDKPGVDAKEDDKPGVDAKEDDKPGVDAKEDDKPGKAPEKKKRREKEGRIFFHISEVMDNLVLKVGDTVEFIECINSRTKELNARKIKRTKEAPVRTPPTSYEKPAKVERPDHLKFGSETRLAMRLAKGPDGTRGFSREYQESRGKVFPDPVEEVEEEVGLNVSAAPFVPNIAATPFVPANKKE